MQTIFSDGRWQVVLRVSNELLKQGFAVNTDTKGRNGKYSVAVDMRERVAAKRVVAAMFDAEGYFIN